MRDYTLLTLPLIAAFVFAVVLTYVTAEEAILARRARLRGGSARPSERDAIGDAAEKDEPMTADTAQSGEAAADAHGAFERVR